MKAPLKHSKSSAYSPIQPWAKSDNDIIKGTVPVLSVLLFDEPTVGTELEEDRVCKSMLAILVKRISPSREAFQASVTKSYAIESLLNLILRSSDKTPYNASPAIL